MTPPVSRTASPAAQLGDATVKDLIALGTEEGGAFGLLGKGLVYSLSGIQKTAGGSSLLSIVSNRVLIARKAAEAKSKGGRYVPPPSIRADLVFITCGDVDIADRWDCNRVSVTSPTGRAIMPRAYDATPKVYRNALGASWTGRKVEAAFAFPDLREGFVVTYSGVDGIEYMEKVSKEEADRELLFSVLLPSALRAAEAAKAEAERAAEAARIAAALAAVPTDPLFTVTAAPDGRSWTIATQNRYTWETCKAVIDASTAALPPLAPGTSATVRLADFNPKLAPAPRKPSVWCTVANKVFEGPVPSEFAITVRQPGAGIWQVINLTEWAWYTCSANFGDRRAEMPYLAPKGMVTLTQADFRQRNSDNTDGTNMRVSCQLNGKTVVAVQRGS
jgi:hypothetical protein